MTRILFISASLAALSLASPALAQSSPAPEASLSAGNAAAMRGPEDAARVGALIEFAYERGALYQVEAAPQRITDIALEPGETLLSVSAGDTTRWIVGDARSGGPGANQAHVLVKPNAANLSTNLIIMTDRRVYHVELRSTSGPAMAAVAWRYPEEMIWLSALPAAPASGLPPVNPSSNASAHMSVGVSSQPSTDAPMPAPLFSPERLNLRYRIEGDATDWRPLSAFDDGQQVYIEMPETLVEAPPLSVIGDEGLEAVNYRIRGRFYIVDRLFKKAELRLGTGRTQKRVTITRQTPINAANTAGGRNG